MSDMGDYTLGRDIGPVLVWERKGGGYLKQNHQQQQHSNEPFVMYSPHVESTQSMTQPHVHF